MVQTPMTESGVAVVIFHFWIGSRSRIGSRVGVVVANWSQIVSGDVVDQARELESNKKYDTGSPVENSNYAI